MSQFDDLPTRTQLLILSYLDLNSLLSCRRVSKNLRNNVNRIRIDSLTVNEHQSSSEYAYDACKYFLTNHLTGYGTHFSTTNLHFFDSNLMRLILSRLRRLCIDGQWNVFEDANHLRANEFDLEIFNQFQSLEALEINLRHFRLNCTLKLDNLLTCSFKNCHYYANLHLIAPNLFALRSDGSLEFISFSNPEKMTHLFVHYEISFKSRIRQFVNLVYLFIFDGFITRTDLPDLVNFPWLEQLHLKKVKPDILNAILSQRELENLNFTIYLNGFRVDTRDDLEPFRQELRGYGDDELGDYQLQNFTDYLLTQYSRTCEVMHDIIIPKLDYNTLMQYELPDDFHDKVINIKTVKVGHNNTQTTVNQREFVNFLRQIKGLIELQIQNVSFDESFYKDLNTISPFLKRLTINQTRSPNQSPNSFDFLLNFKRLMIFNTDLSVRAGLVYDLFSRLEKLKSFRFTYRNQEYEIRRNGSNFRITGFDHLEFDDLAFIVLLLRKQRS